MDMKTMERAQELHEFMKQCREAMEAWEHADPLMPDRIRHGAFPINNGNLPRPSPETWHTYQRAAIRDLEQAQDRAKAEFDKL